MIIVHLIDWSEIPMANFSIILKEILHTSLIFFVALTWANIIQAYGNYENLTKPITKLYKRVWVLILIYFIYNLTKLFIFDFSTSNFWLQYINKWTFNVEWILSFKSFTSPITVLILDSMFLILSPLLLLLNKKAKYKKTILFFIILSILIINYFIILPNYLPFNPKNPFFPIEQNIFLDVIYWRWFVLFPMALWAVPYLVWSLLSMLWFEKKRNVAIIFFATITIILWTMKVVNNETLMLNPYIFPLMPYYMFVSFFALFVFTQITIWLEKSKNEIVYKSLAMLRFLGDNSLRIYLYHWIAIDLAIWIFYPNLWMTWVVMIIYLSWHIYLKRKMITDYIDYWYRSWHYHKN